MNFRLLDDHTIGISLDETTIEADVVEILTVLNHGQSPAFSTAELGAEPVPLYPAPFACTTPFLRQAVFHRYHLRTEMLRYIRRLESRDLSLTTSMIPLGSCTMKPDGTAERMPVSWPQLARLQSCTLRFTRHAAGRLFSGTGSSGSRRSPALPRFRFSPTRGRKVSMPGCWSSKNITSNADNPAATSASSRPPRMDTIPPALP